MKKILTVAMACCFAMTGCIALAACDNKTKSDPAHTIVFYSSQGDNLTGTTDIAIETFEAKYPGWTVTHNTQGGYEDVLSKVRSDLTAGTQPDLAYCYADHVAQYLASGTVVDMSEYLLNDQPFTYTYTADGAEQTKTVDRIGFTQEDIDTFVTGYFEEGYAENFADYASYGYEAKSLLTLPFVKSTEVLYYNPDALKELNETVPTTWDKLWAICDKARAKWPTCTPLGYDSEANWFITMGQQLGYEYTSADESNHYLFNNDGAAAWLNSIKAQYDKGNFTTQQIYGSYTSSLFTKGPEDAGCIFCIGSTGGAKNQAGTNFTTEVSAIPGSGEGKNQCISQGPSLVMFSTDAANDSEKQIMTFQFVKELLATEFQAKFSRVSGYAPMRTDVYANADFQLFRDGKASDGSPLTGTDLIISKCVKAGVGGEFNARLFVSPAFVGSSTARQQMTSVVQYVLLGQKEAAAALQDAYKACGGK